MQGRADLVPILLAHGANLGDIDDDKNTPYMVAGENAEIKKLLEDEEAKRKGGFSPAAAMLLRLHE